MDHKTFSDKDIWGFWELTKPQGIANWSYASRYRAALGRVLKMPEDARYKRPFRRKKTKGKGGFRVIRNPKPDLKLVQNCISEWLKRKYGIYDFILNRKIKGGSLAVARSHKDFKWGITFDLTSAFEQIDAKLIRERFHRTLAPQYIDLLIECVTYQGRLPQGCGSSTYMFSAVFAPVDVALAELCKSFTNEKRNMYITRYGDDILVTSNASGRKLTIFIADRATLILQKRGFHGIKHLYYTPPVNYLGVHIFPKRVVLNTKKFREIKEALTEAVNSENPREKRRSVMGYLGWVKRVYGNLVPVYLLHKFEQYFKLAPPIPEKLVLLLNPPLRKR